MRMRLATAIALLTLLEPCWAAPPPPGSEDAEILGAFAQWIRVQHGVDGRWCCDISDGRPLHDDEIRRNGDAIEVFVSRAHWFTAPEPGVWMTVPVSARIHTPNPVGIPIVWFYDGRVWCFIDGNGS